MTREQLREALVLDLVTLLNLASWAFYVVRSELRWALQVAASEL